MTTAAPALAKDRLELWINPSFAAELDAATFIEFETAQRFRAAPRDDTYYARLWLGRELADGVTLSVGTERRYEGGERETRLLQQLSYPIGPLSGRTRVEQRFLSDAPDTAWRVRQRIGGALPLQRDPGGWLLTANVEGFFTLAPADHSGQTGLTGIRTFIGFQRELGRLDLSLGYLRQQTVRADAPDTVGHAPFFGLGLSF